MHLKDLFVPALKCDVASWQIGSMLTDELENGGIALIFCSDDRGSGGSELQKNFDEVRRSFYQLSKQDFSKPICDLGDLLSGKTEEDTQYVLQEILEFCYQEKVFPIVIGGGESLAKSIFKSIENQKNKINYTQVNPIIDFDKKDKIDGNYLIEILKNPKLQQYSHLGYQKHLNNPKAIELLSKMRFDMLRLAEMMGRMDRIEPFLRKADVVTLSCDAVESFAGAFSLSPQVNGLNRREICACMKEIGCGENLKSVGIFSYNFDAKNFLNHQLLAQMLWYLLEGIHIRETHPKEKNFEVYQVLWEEESYTFHREIFRDLWYFGEGNEEKSWLPCSWEDFENVKKGNLAPRFLR